MYVYTKDRCEIYIKRRRKPPPPTINNCCNMFATRQQVLDQFHLLVIPSPEEVHNQLWTLEEWEMEKVTTTKQRLGLCFLNDYYKVWGKGDDGVIIWD